MVEDITNVLDPKYVDVDPDPAKWYWSESESESESLNITAFKGQSEVYEKQLGQGFRPNKIICICILTEIWNKTGLVYVNKDPKPFCIIYFYPYLLFLDLGTEMISLVPVKPIAAKSNSGSTGVIFTPLKVRI